LSLQKFVRDTKPFLLCQQRLQKAFTHGKKALSRRFFDDNIDFKVIGSDTLSAKEGAIDLEDKILQYKKWQEFTATNLKVIRLDVEGKQKIRYE
jgi:hypothetical protein